MENSRLVPVVILTLIIFTCCMIPINILSKGYLPHDDALRHVAKVISGKEWNDILILKPEVRMDSHPGWHKILELIYRVTDMNARSMVMLSVAMLFIWFAVIPAFFSDRPEAWLISLLIISMSDFGSIQRLLLGRPYIFTMSWVVFLSFSWRKLRNRTVLPGVWIPLLLYSAAATWIHCNWSVFGFPVICFFLAGERRAALNLSVILIIAVILGACLTGHPFLFLKQTLLHGLTALSQIHRQYMLVSEFRSGAGTPVLIIAVILIILNRVSKDSEDSVLSNPIFIMAASGYVLQFSVLRFWYDIGFPALSVWIAIEIGEMLKKNSDKFSWKRAGTVMFLCMTFYLYISNDYEDRWSTEWDKKFLVYENPANREWLPEPGGIIYNLEMTAFIKFFIIILMRLGAMFLASSRQSWQKKTSRSIRTYCLLRV
ncbi:MAG: hypothetical protein HC887_01710 [Desulfobacteraceae bacterium]|nr:hypothetical protein [Desulfobacteraceae bacterium]